MKTLEQETFSTAWPEAPAGPPPPRRPRFAMARELPILIVVALSMALLIKTFLIQAFYIPSESMVPTLLVNDRVLVNKLAYRFRDPRRGEVVVFITGNLAAQKRSLFESIYKNVGESLGVLAPGDTDFIKRVIGLPGDTIQIRRDEATGRGSVQITQRSGKPFILPESYIRDPAALNEFGPFTVPDGRYFLMGDNRGNSSDSRSNNFGGVCPTAPCAVPKSRLVGKAFVRIWPARRIHVFQLPLYGAVMFGGFRFRRRRRDVSERGRRGRVTTAQGVLTGGLFRTVVHRSEKICSIRSHAPGPGSRRSESMLARGGPGRLDGTRAC
ncbi:MAG: signal peptidase I [Actinomycetota bacterium]